MILAGETIYNSPMTDESITPNPERFNLPPDSSDEVDADADTWVTEEEVDALASERDIMGTDHVAQAEAILKENLPSAVHSVAKLARLASNETVRLNAAKYIIDRNLGKVVEPQVEIDDPTKRLLEGVVVG